MLGPALRGVYAGGSWALGDYVPGRSDLDVAVVLAGPLSRAAADEMVAAARHEALPCPARGLELVVYSAETAAAGLAEPGFELNLNTGEGMADLVELAGATREPHWYAIDRSILAQRGVALAGPPAQQMFSSPPRAVVVGLLAESMDWHRAHAADDDAVLNTCRAFHFARMGTWVSKTQAGRWMLDQPEAGERIARALAARARQG